MKEDEDKILVLDRTKVMLGAGEHGDRVQFTEFIARNMALYALTNGYHLSTQAAANFTRGELARSIREHPYQVNLIIAGYDKVAGPEVYFLDYMGSMQKMNFAVHGYSGYFLLSLLDRHYKDNMSVEDGMTLLRMCITELRTRFLLSPSKFIVKIVDKDGVRALPLELA